MSLILLVFAFVLAVVAAFVDTIPGPLPLRIGWLAFACYVAASLFGR